MGVIHNDNLIKKESLMTELITINYDNEQPTVLGRDLHEALEVKTDYSTWFKRMCEYDFQEGKDFSSFLGKSTGGRPSIDYQLTIPMAKEICMLQRSEKGKMFRQYFISVEEQWNTPEAVMARALQFASKQLDIVKNQNKQLTETVAVQTQQIAEMQPKVSYYDLVLNSKGLVTITQIAKDYGMSGKKMNSLLHDLGVQYKQSGQWMLYSKYHEKGYTHSRTINIVHNDGTSDSRMETKWTQKGRLFIYKLLKSQNILPLIEQDVSA